MLLAGRGFLRISDLRRLSLLPIVKRAGVPAIRMYDLRQTSATLLLSRDVNVKEVAERLGHEDISITLRHYAPALPSRQEKAAAAVESLFRGIKFGDSPTHLP